MKCDFVLTLKYTNGTVEKVVGDNMKDLMEQARSIGLKENATLMDLTVNVVPYFPRTGEA